MVCATARTLVSIRRLVVVHTSLLQLKDGHLRFILLRAQITLVRVWHTMHQLSSISFLDVWSSPVFDVNGADPSGGDQDDLPFHASRRSSPASSGFLSGRFPPRHNKYCGLRNGVLSAASFPPLLTSPADGLFAVFRQLCELKECFPPLHSRALRRQHVAAAARSRRTASAQAGPSLARPLLRHSMWTWTTRCSQPAYECTEAGPPSFLPSDAPSGRDPEHRPPHDVGDGPPPTHASLLAIDVSAWACRRWHRRPWHLCHFSHFLLPWRCFDVSSRTAPFSRPSKICMHTL